MTITEAPTQTVDVLAGWAVMLGGKVVSTFTVTVAVPEHPLVVPVTEYGPAAETEMDGVLSPDDQLYELPPEAVSVALWPDKMLRPGFGVIATTGNVLTVSVVEAAVVVKLLATVSVKVCTPLPPAVTD